MIQMQILNIVVTFCIAYVGYIVAKKMKITAPALIGSMIMVGVINVIFDYSIIPSNFKIIAQALAGAYIAIQITLEDILSIKKLIKPFILLILMFTINTFTIGTVIHFWKDIDFATALFSSVAGGVADISIISMSLKADSGIVAIFQTLRLLSVLLLFPYLIKINKNKSKNNYDLFSPENFKKSESIPINKSSNEYLRIIISVLLALLLGYIGNISKIPAGAMIVPIVILIVINCKFTNKLLFPNKIKIFAQLIAGIVVGVSFRSTILLKISDLIGPIILLLISYWMLNYIFMSIASKKRWLKRDSAMLASAPGGATDMALIAEDLGVDIKDVAIIQIFRAIFVIIAMPTFISIFLNYFR